jgi:Cupin domain
MARGNEGGEVTERNRLMNKHAITAQPISLIPPDDLRRKLAVARPNENEKLPHIALMGDTYTVLLSGDDTDGRYCLIDMLIRRAEARVRIGMTLRNPSPSSKAKSRLPFAAKNPVVRAGETINIPANAPHSFRNASQNPVRLLCICAPAGQEKFFAEVGIAVACRATVAPALDEAAQNEFIKRAQDLAPKYRTELLKR